MTISPFTVYLVMQADEVCTAFFLASIISPSWGGGAFCDVSHGFLQADQPAV